MPEWNAEKHHDDQCDGHDNGLNEIRGGSRQKSAQRGIQDNDHGGDNHGGEVIHAEEAGEQGAAGVKAGGGIGNEENDDNQRSDQ